MDKKYWDILLSKEYGKIHALMQTLSEESLSDPTRIERVFRSLGIDDDGSICVPDDAPEGYEQAPHLAAFLHWKKGFLEAQRVRHKKDSIRDLLKSDELIHVRHGTELLTTLALETPSIFDVIVGEIRENKYGIQIPEWLLLAPYRCYVCVYTLAWKAARGIPAQRDREVLKLGGYGAREIPENIGAFSQLKNLSYGEGNISVLPDGIEALQNLEEVDLSENHFYTVPDVLLRLPNLRRLYLSDNMIKKIPSELGNLSLLESLSIEGNPIASLPEELEKLSELKTLNLSYTKLETFPLCVTKLTGLEQLALRGALFEVLPQEFSRLTSLKKVSLVPAQEALRAEILRLFPEIELGFVY